MEMEISVELHFSSAHHLPLHEGACRRLHGHNYRLRVTLGGMPEGGSGMLMDFETLKKKVWDTCLVEVDHRNLNDIFENPTAENMLLWLWKRLEPEFKNLKELVLWETPEYLVTLRKS
ncbi:MAG: 6-carboxytetrahydropterin synthase QueD [Cystobacterineae bacterium]|nr:6-carboxytetrahydropterin synthase QueD [Cystobacterineae bacterium]